MRKGVPALLLFSLSLTCAASASARIAPLEEQIVLPACLIAQAHPPLQIPLCTHARVSAPSGASTDSEVEWRLITAGHSPREIRNRIHYVSTRQAALRWLPYLNTPSDRRTLRRVNFRTYGVLLIFHRPVAATITLDKVTWRDHGLNAYLTLAPWVAPPCSTPPCSPPPNAPPSARYILAAVQKASLPAPVKLLHITESTAAP